MENENQENQEQLNQDPQPEIHTEREVELEHRITELTAQITQLVDQNKKLYLKLSGTNEQKEPSIEDMLADALHEWAESGFNPDLLCK